MNDHALPAELVDIEKSLSATRAPTNEFVATRVLSRARLALMDERRRRRNSFLATMAAILVLGLHLATWATTPAPAPHVVAPDAGQLAAATETVRELLPGVEEEEARRYARRILLQANFKPATVGRRFALPPPYALRESID